MSGLLLRSWPLLCHLQFSILLVVYTYFGLSPSPGGELMPAYNDKLMHFAGYLVAGLSISLAWPARSLWQRGLFLLSYSVAIEVGQHFMPPRTFEWWDIVANGCGIIAGLALYTLLQRLAPAALKPLLRAR